MDSEPRKPSQPSTVSFFERLIATGIYAGYAPWAPGTMGSLVGLLIYFVPGLENPLPFLSIIVLTFFAGTFVAARVAAVEGNKLTATSAALKSMMRTDLSTKSDPSVVVIDEIVGMWVALFLLPKTIGVAVVSFLVFRLFDIVKPFPARNLERIPGGWGIMLDDVIAGVYTNIVCRGCVALIPSLAY